MPVREFEDLLKKYVESKIVNYKYHELLYRKYEQEKNKISCKVKSSGPCFRTGSVIPKPEENYNSIDSQNRVLQYRVDELENLMRYEKTFLDEVDVWIDTCCRTKNQHMIIQNYMIDNQCTGVEEVAKLLGYSVTYIMKFRNTFIETIIFKYF